jgi:hypothetical protein
LDPFGRLGNGAKQCPTLEVLALRVAHQWVEVIPGVDHVHAQGFGLGRGTAYVGILRMFRIN